MSGSIAFLWKGWSETMMMGALLAKGIADFTFGGAFLWYLVKFIVSLILAFCAIMLGIKWRKSKNDKNN